MTIYGLEFSIDSVGPINIDVPFVISDSTYNTDLLTGTLANGTSISADIFNGISGSQIVVMQAIPLPAGMWLLGPALLVFRIQRRQLSA